MDEASFFQSAWIPGLYDDMRNVKVPEAVDTGLVAYHIMLIIGSKVVAGVTHISLRQGLKVFDVKVKVPCSRN